ncbi:MAG: hypothetical protein ACP5I8_04970 [Phycisphaerae bacterium]
MQALIEALISEITGDAPLAAMFGAAPAVYLTEAPESAALPLVILRVGAGRVSHDFSGVRITTVAVAFQIVATDINTAVGGAERLGTLLDNATLALSTGRLLGCRRTEPVAPAMPGFNSLQTAIYTAGLRLECQVFQAA